MQLTWTAPDNQHSASGETVDASVYGLGIVLDKQIVPETEVTVCVSGTILCGTGNVRYSKAVENGFRTGLQFQTTLVMQGIPELDAILMTALKPKSKQRLRQLGHSGSLLKSVADCHSAALTAGTILIGVVVCIRYHWLGLHWLIYKRRQVM